MKSISILFCCGMIMISCNTNNTNKPVTADDNRIDNKEVVTDMHTAENSLDYYGTYNGVLPSAGGEGINTKLTLKNNGTYELVTVYIGKGDNKYTENGTYTLKGNMLTLSDDNKQEKYYRVGENRLIQLDMDKNDITGDLAEDYILKKEN